MAKPVKPAPETDENETTPLPTDEAASAAPEGDAKGVAPIGEPVDDSDVVEGAPESIATQETDDLDLDEEPPAPAEGKPSDEAKPDAEAVAAKPDEAKPAEAEPPKVVEPAAEPKPAEPAAAAAPAEPTAPTDAKPPAETPEEQKPAEVAAVEPLTDAQVQEQYDAWRKPHEEALVGHYALSDEMVEELQTNAEVVIPKLLAKVHADVLTAVLGHTMRSMPGMVESVMTSRGQAQTDETAFYTMWPGLNPAEHGELVGRLGASYRQLNPNATREQFMQEVGAQAHVAARLPVDAAPTPPAEPAPVPFTPATGAPAPAGGTEPQNAFATLATQSEDLDLD